MAIILKVERVWEGDEQSIKIVKLRALRKHRLPDKYLNEGGFWYEKDGFHTHIGLLVQVGYIITKEALDHLYNYISNCGTRLKEIRDEWSGEETFII